MTTAFYHRTYTCKFYSQPHSLTPAVQSRLENWLFVTSYSVKEPLYSTQAYLVYVAFSSVIFVNYRDEDMICVSCEGFKIQSLSSIGAAY